MGDLEDLIRRVKIVRDGLKDHSLLIVALDTPENQARMKQLQIEQLNDGVRSDNAPIKPSIYDDPFFQSRKSAERYARYKSKRFPNPNRPDGVPNLRLSNGLFHSGFYVEFGKDYIKFKNDQKIPDFYGKEHDVYEKYGADTFGLTDENWEKVNVKDQVLTAIRAELGI